MNITDLKSYIANHRPTELNLKAYVGGELFETLTTEPQVDFEGNPLQYKTGGVLRIAEGIAQLGQMTGKDVTFEHNTDAFSARLGAKLLGK